MEVIEAYESELDGYEPFMRVGYGSVKEIFYIYKCKNCNYKLRAKDNTLVYLCLYCGTVLT